MKILFAFIILTFSFTVFSQGNKKKTRKEYEKILSEQSKFITGCEKQIKENQIKNFGKDSSKIAENCEWASNGCPLKIVKPIYPDSARKREIIETVKVEIIIDEQGKVVYSKAVSGKTIFHLSAERAALLSLYKPKIVCEKVVIQKKYIVYNFSPN